MTYNKHCHVEDYGVDEDEDELNEDSDEDGDELNELQREEIVPVKGFIKRKNMCFLEHCF